MDNKAEPPGSATRGFLYKLPIDKSLIMWYNWPGAHDQGARNFHYTTLLAFCQAKSRTNLHKLFLPNLCNIPSWNLWLDVIIYWCQGERPGRATVRWVSRRLRRSNSRVFPLKKNVKSPLTNRPSCDTIRVSKGRETPSGRPLPLSPSQVCRDVE